MLINIHTHSRKNEPENSVFAIQNIVWTQTDALLSYPTDAHYSVGVHPWYLDKTEINWAEFEAFAQSKNIVAIGECGLDKAIKTPLAAQIPIFVQQIHLAERLQKPVIVHCVRAYNEVLSIIKQEKPQIPLILHGFNKNLEVAKMFFPYHVYFSFGKNVLKENFDGGLLQHIYSQNKLFLETDDAHISIIGIYERAAEHLHIGVAELAQAIEKNYVSCGFVVSLHL